MNQRHAHRLADLHQCPPVSPQLDNPLIPHMRRHRLTSRHRCPLLTGVQPLPQRITPAPQIKQRPRRVAGRDELVYTDLRGGVLRESFPSITPHDLRHTAASLAVSAGANVKAVQRMLGHAKASMMLDVYADLDDVAVNLHAAIRAAAGISSFAVD